MHFFCFFSYLFLLNLESHALLIGFTPDLLCYEICSVHIHTYTVFLILLYFAANKDAALSPKSLIFFSALIPYLHNIISTFEVPFPCRFVL